MDEELRRMQAQRETFERATGLLSHMRDNVGLAFPTELSRSAIARELVTQSKLLGYVNTQIYDPLAEISLSKHDELEQLKASLGLGSMLPSSAGEFLRQSVMGELNAGRLYRDQSLAGAAQNSAVYVSSMASATEMLRSRQESASYVSALSAFGSAASRDFAYRFAEYDEIGVLAEQAIAADRLSAYAYAGSVGLGSLAARMEAMCVPWLKTAHELESVSAFAHLQTVGDLVHDVAPYAQGAAAYLRADLGDWRDTLALPVESPLNADERTEIYQAQGFNAELTAFPPPAFLRSALIARLLEVEEEDLGEWCDADADELARNKAAFNRLQHFELALRKFIVKTMLAAFGDTWMHRRLPAGMLDKWIAKRDTAVRTGAQELALIDYADFTDYLPVIEKKENWRELYQNIFKRPEDIKESLQRMYPVRIATMHARVVTLDDTLLLMVETKRVTRAFASWN